MSAVTCPDCDGSGEIWECRSKGRPCSHTNDIWHRCLTCKGTGDVDDPRDLDQDG